MCRLGVKFDNVKFFRLVKWIVFFIWEVRKLRKGV